MQIIMSDQNNGSVGDEKFSSVLPMGLVSQETLTLLNSLGKGSIDEKLKAILNEKREQSEMIAKFKSDLEEERNRSRTLEKQVNKPNDSHSNLNGTNESEQRKQLQKEIDDLKSRLQRYETDNSRVLQEVSHDFKALDTKICVESIFRIKDTRLNRKRSNNNLLMQNEKKKSFNRNEECYIKR